MSPYICPICLKPMNKGIKKCVNCHRVVVPLAKPNQDNMDKCIIIENKWVVPFATPSKE